MYSIVLKGRLHNAQSWREWGEVWGISYLFCVTGRGQDRNIRFTKHNSKMYKSDNVFFLLWSGVTRAFLVATPTSITAADTFPLIKSPQPTTYSDPQRK